MKLKYRSDLTKHGLSSNRTKYILENSLYCVYISKHKNMLVAAIIISWISLVKLYIANIYSASR